MTSNGNAWVLTGGLHRGVMKLVGQALRKCGDGGGNRVPCIGICTWGYTRKRHVLVNNGNSTPALYKPVDYIGLDATSQPLDSNHTHFILVDDGTEGKPLRQIGFRNDFIQTIAEERVGGEFACTVCVSQWSIKQCNPSVLDVHAWLHCSSALLLSPCPSFFCIPVSPSVCVFLYPCICFRTYLSVRLCVCLSLFVSVSVCVCLLIGLPVSMAICAHPQTSLRQRRCFSVLLTCFFPSHAIESVRMRLGLH